MDETGARDTELRDALRRAEERNRLYEAVLTSVEDLVYVLDPAGRFRYANRAILDLWGMRPDEAFGKDFEELGYPPELVELHRAQLAEVVRTRAPVRGENYYTNPEGRTGYYEYIFVPLPDATGAVRAIAGITRDITRRKAIEEELARLLERERSARADAERHAREEAALRRATEAMESAFTTEEVLRRIARAALDAVAAAGSFVLRLDDELEALAVVDAAGENVPPSGTRLPFAGSSVERVLELDRPQVFVGGSGSIDALHGFESHCGQCPLVLVPLQDSGESIGALGLVRGPGEGAFSEDDVGRLETFAKLASLAFRKVHLFEAAERSSREHQSLLESRGRLVRGFSHDLKNPLGAADGRLELLEHGVFGELAPEQAEGVRRARKSIRAGFRLLDSLAELARAEAGKLPIERAPVDARGVASDVAEEYRAAAESKGLTMRVELKPDLPIIQSDPDRVRQILGNLVSNAVKYTDSGGVTVRVREAAAGVAPGRGPWVVVDVSDTGPGIPEDHQEEIFSEFTRLEPGKGRGAGLGLAISRRLARLLGGDVVVGSEPDRGSTFSLYLPRRAAGEEDRGGEAAASAA